MFTFSSNSTIKKLVINISPDQMDCCVYKIPCKDCDKYYIGQTGKDLAKRIKQHKYSVRTGQVSNALFIHLRDNNHCIDWSNASSIVSCHDILNRNIIESSLIKQSESQLINMSSGMYKLDSFICNKVHRQIQNS